MDLRAGRRLAVGVCALLLVAPAAAHAAGATSPAGRLVTGAAGTQAPLRLERAASVTVEPVEQQRLSGGDGAAFAVVIRARSGRLVYASLVHNAPGFDQALVTPPTSLPPVPPGNYTVALVGPAALPVRVVGLAAGPTLRTHARTDLTLWTMRSAGSAPASAWQEAFALPRRTLALAALVGDTGPASGSTASACLAPAAAATACDQPSAVGAQSNLSSPLPPPAPASSHAHYSWFQHDPAHLHGPAVFTGTSGTGTTTWHALYAVTR